MCRDDVRGSRNIAINVVLQCTFCVNFSRFNMAALQKFSCRQMTDPSFSWPTLLCFGCFSSYHITGKRYPEMDMDRTVEVFIFLGIVV